MLPKVVRVRTRKGPLLVGVWQPSPSAGRSAYRGELSNIRVRASVTLGGGGCAQMVTSQGRSKLGGGKKNGFREACLRKVKPDGESCGRFVSKSTGRGIRLPQDPKKKNEHPVHQRTGLG